MTRSSEGMYEAVTFFFKKYSKLLRTILYITSFIFAVIGSFQLLAPKAESPLMLIPGIAYTVIKLYVFSPAVTPGNPAPLLFQIATWLAPLSTVIGFFSVFEEVYVRVRSYVRARGGERIMVIGLTPDSEIFLKNLTTGGRKAVLLADADISSDERLRVERSGVPVYTMDFSAGDSPLNRFELRRMELDKASAFVVFLPEPLGYGVLTTLDSMIAGIDDVRISRVPTHVRYEDADLKELVRSQMDVLGSFDVNYFDVAELMAIELFLIQGFSLATIPGLEEPWEGEKPGSFEEIDHRIGRPHLLLVGFGTLGRQVLDYALNQGVLTVGNRMRVTIVDPQGAALFDRYIGSIEHHERIMEAQVIAKNLRSRSLHAELGELNREEPFTAVIMTIEDVQASLLGLDKLTQRFDEIHAAIYVPRDVEVGPLMDAFGERRRGVTFFGDKSAILTEDVLMNESLDARARAFNASYNRTAAQIMDWPAPEESDLEQWRGLDSLKKDSSRAQSMHRPVKRAIMERFVAEGLMEGPLDPTLENWRATLDDRPIQEQIEFFITDTARNYLTALEHRRWNTFYYLHDFLWGPVKDEARKVHDSLIDDWRDFMTSPVSDKSIYDFLSVIAVAEERGTDE